MISEHDPFLVLPTERGCHLLWDTENAIPDRNGIEAFGLTYDLRCRGYLREHGDGIVRLADALYERDPNETNPFPQPLLIPLAELERTAPRKAQREGQPDPASALALAVKDHNRNSTLFHFLREWVNKRNPGPDRDLWTLRVQLKASDYNGMMGDPLPRSELNRLSASVAKGQWHYWQGKGKGHYRHDPELQQVRGIKSGQARRERVSARDENIRSMSKHGLSQREIAAQIGLSKTAIQHVLKRGGL